MTEQFRIRSLSKGIIKSLTLLDLRSIYSILVFLSFAYCIFVHFYIHPFEESLYLLPLSLLLVSIVSQKRGLLFRNYAESVLAILLFLRYAIIPFVIYVTGEFSAIASTYKYINDAVGLMILEIFSIFMTLNFFKNLKTKPESVPSVSFNLVQPVIFLVSIASIVICLLNPILFGDIDSVLSGRPNPILFNKLQSIFGLWRIIWIAGLCSVTVYLINFIKSRNSINSNWKKLFLSVFVVMTYLIIFIVGGIKISRWFPLITLISFTIYLGDLYKLKLKAILLKISVFFLVFILPLSYIKMGLLKEANRNIKGGQFYSTVIESYLSGPTNFNLALALSKEYNAGIKNILSDLFMNFPGVARRINEKNTTHYQYNKVAYRHLHSREQLEASDFPRDQIIPLSGQSMIYFGIYFTPVLSLLFVILTMSMANVWIKIHDPFMRFLCIFTMVWLSFAYCLNLTIILSWVYIYILPLFLIFLVNKKIRDMDFKRWRS